LASQIVVVLQGKDKPTYAPHVENGDMCIVLNARISASQEEKWLIRFTTGTQGW
jgi:ribosomal protein L13